MKLVSFRRGDVVSYGVVRENRIVPVKTEFAGQYPTLQSVIEQEEEEGALFEIKRLFDQETTSYSFSDVTFLPVISRPEKILCVGLNYQMHRIETGRDESEYPVLFTRFANTLVGHNEKIIRPHASEQLDFEGELAVIIGKAGRHVAPANALAHIAGYACFNDATLRDWQRHTHQFTPGKNFPATGGFGPWLVTTDEINDYSQLTLVTRLNGEEMQHTTTNQMIFNIPTLISYISTFTELKPGDVIATGTPGGVGAKRSPPVFMKPGDEVEVEISGIGTLRNTIAAEE
ncbi:MAG: fumarylacetoacetate hydrolase family protein [Pyrinomonadaceae bacterium]